MLKKSQKRTKRAALMELLMSGHQRLVGTDDPWPSMRAKPMMIF
jgi:hypothetical protein